MGRGTSSLPASEKFQRRGNIRDKGLRKRSLFSASYDFDVRGTKEETNGSGKTSYRDRPVGWFLRKSQNLSGIKSKHVSYHASHIHRGARGENARLPSQLVSHENRSATPFSSLPPPLPTFFWSRFRDLAIFRGCDIHIADARTTAPGFLPPATRKFETRKQFFPSLPTAGTDIHGLLNIPCRTPKY